MTGYDHVWRWRTRSGWAGERYPHPFAARFGDRCRVVARGAMNSVLIEFESDGLRAVVSRHAVRRAL